MVGLGITQVYVVGFEIHRFYAPSLPFVALAIGLLMSTRITKDSGEIGLYTLLGLSTLYMGIRGMLCEVPILSLKEVPLISYGVIVFTAASALFRHRGPAFALTSFIACISSIQLFYQLSNESIQEVLPRMWGEIKGLGRGHGLFRHYNPFASYCALISGTLGALLCIRMPSKGTGIFARFLLLIILGITCCAAYHSGSRLGTGVTILSALVGCSLSGCFRVAITNGRVASVNRLSLILGVLALGVMLSIGGFLTTFNKLSETRGMKGSVSNDIVGGMRISSIGMGFSLWSESPLIGHGPRAYSYNAPRLRQEKSNYGVSGGEAHPDAEMVHNDYIQTLAEYGVVGLLLILITLTYLLGWLWNKGWNLRYQKANWYLAPTIASTTTLALMIHSLGDFTVHNLAVFLPYCFILGACWGACYQEETSENLGNSMSYPVMRSIAVFIAVGVLYTVASKQIIHSRLLIDYDYAKWHNTSIDALTLAKQAAEKAPDPDILESLGREYLRRASQTDDLNEQHALLTEAEAYLTEAHALHPYRIETLVNLAGVIQQQGRHKEVEHYLNQAFKWTNERWNRYALGHLAASHLMREGQRIWEQRDAPKAMAYFQKALEYNEKGFYTDKDGYKEIRKQRQEVLEQNLKILEMGRVKPEQDLTFFQGYGL